MSCRAPGARTGGGRARRCQADPSSCCGCRARLRTAAQELGGVTCGRQRAKMLKINTLAAHTHMAGCRILQQLEVTHHTSRVTRHTSHVAHHTLHATRHTSHITHHTLHITRHTSNITRHTSHITHHTSHVTRHTSHVTRHTSHVTRHTSHATRHTTTQVEDSEGGGRGLHQASLKTRARENKK